MAQLAIKGHATRGKEVIKILEMLGGKNTHDYICNIPDYAYSISEQGIIEWFMAHINSPIPIAIFTLEEFLEKFPYKVGDKVSSKYLKNYEVSNMEWLSAYNRAIYKLQGMGWYSADVLQPYKEETMEDKDIIKPTTKINLNHPCFDGRNEIELIIPEGWAFEQRDGKMFGVRKQYPKTYEECCKVLLLKPERATYSVSGLEYERHLIVNLQRLLICRDAYWKIAGDWKPNYINPTKESMYFIFCNGINKEKGQGLYPINKVLIFPTEEMRDAFYENFNDDLELCKELL